MHKRRSVWRPRTYVHGVRLIPRSLRSFLRSWRSLSCYGTGRFITVFIKAHRFALILSQFISVNIFALRFFNINFNITVPSTPRSSRLSLPLRFSYKNFVCIFHLLHLSTAARPTTTRPSYSSRFSHPNASS